MDGNVVVVASICLVAALVFFIDILDNDDNDYIDPNL